MAGGSLFQVGEAVEFWRVLVHLSILALCLLIFEGALHHIEHKLSRYDKYQHMLRKAYRELMVLGLLSLGLKLLKEVPGIHADSKTMLAFQVADLSIFILALALIIQSICVFMQLRKHNNLADRTELVTAQDIVDALSCAVYDLDDIYGEFGLLPAVMVPLPLAVNTLFLQQSIFRHFVMICSILRIDSTTLGEVVNHFSEIVELRSEFASSLAQCLREGEYTATDLRTELRGHDLRETGFIDLDNLRIVLAAFGFRLTRFRFNSVAKLLFELEGTKVEYGQLLRLIMLAQQDNCGESGVGNQRRQHPLLQRSGTSLNESGRNNFRTNFASARQVPLLAQPSLGSEPSPSDFVHVGTGTPVLPPMRHAASSIASESHGKNGKGGKPMLERSYTNQFAGSSSRALHDMFNIRRRVGSRAEAEVPNSAYTML
ncbi:hypothetical protein JM16_009497 [Phytophthora kernoviae]|uniref:EF-hand domain-containing protein n=1 Tax=Phytophthora kernoviae TaxID=325452 RepID=A0A8T0LJS4_9STRA|nr:hypothetical protein JM16_009497 [Phytophthora kernoviae]